MSYTVTLYCSSNVNLLFPNIMGFFGVCVSLYLQQCLPYIFMYYSLFLCGEEVREKKLCGIMSVPK